MKFENYVREIQLIYKQHPNDQREEELYSLLLSILRERKNCFDLSVRDVHLPLNHRNELLYGLTSYPDFIITKVNFKDNQDKFDHSNLLGCVEVKALGVDLPMDYQILGHLIWYKKVLYTNGLCWKFYEFNNKIDSAKLEHISHECYEKLKEVYKNNNKGEDKKEIVKMQYEFLRDYLKVKNNKSEYVTEITMTLCETEELAYFRKNAQKQLPDIKREKWDSLLTILDTIEW